MTLFSNARLAAAIRTYGQPAQMNAGAVVNAGTVVDVTLLVSQITPVRHSDLPNEGMRADALMLVPALSGMPPDGAVVSGEAGSWLVESAVPLDRADQPARQPAGVRLYQVQMLRTSEERPLDERIATGQATTPGDRQ